MSWLRNVFSSVESNASQRINNPFYGAFILSWLVFNWKIILIILFSQKNIYSVIDDVDDSLCIEYGFIYPFLSSLGLLFILPFANVLYSYFDALIKYLNDKSKYVTFFIDSFFARRKSLILRRHKNKLKNIDLDYQLEWAQKKEEVSKLNRDSALHNAQINEIEELRDKVLNGVNVHISLKEDLIMLSRAIGKLSASLDAEPFKTIYYQNQEDGPIRHYSRALELINNINAKVDELQEKEGWKVTN